MSELKKAAVLSYVNIILTNVVGLVLTPFIIRSLGDSEYGLYSLIGSFVAYLTLMDLGLNNTIVRFVSKYRAEKNIEGEQSFLGTTMLVYCVISTVLVIFGMLLYYNLETVFGASLSAAQMDKAKVMFLILVFNIAITLPGGTFLAICTAYEKFVFPKVVMIVKYILRALVVWVFLTLGGKSISLVIIDTVLGTLVFLTTYIYCISKLKVRFKFYRLDRLLVKQIFTYSFWIFLMAIISKFQWNGGQVILGINTNTEVVAVFAIGLMLGGYFGAFSGVINTLLLPKAANMIVGSNTPGELTNAMIKVGRANMFISFLILSVFFVFGQEFIQLWVGNAYIESWDIALIIMCASIIPLSQSFGLSILEVKNRIKHRAIGMFISMSIAMLAGYYGSKSFGMYGIIIPIAIGMFVSTIINNILFVKVFRLDIITFYKETFLYQTIFAGLFTYSIMYVKNYFVINSWLDFLVALSLSSFLYILLYFRLIFSEDERVIVLKNT